MLRIDRSDENPVLIPQGENSWEAVATFNGCPVLDEKGKIHFLYRAASSPQTVFGSNIEVSSIGYAQSVDGIHFKNRRQFIKPEYEWERFGCEDPRVTKLGNKYYIFYTALSTYPFAAEGIRIGGAITKDFKKIEAKFPVTPFNSKAMALFPEKINGRMAAVLTVNTDSPNAQIAIAFFDHEDQIWSREYWENWYFALNAHVLPLQRSPQDHIEVGAPPIKTKHGWLLIYSYIRNYFSPPATFGIEAVLLNLENLLKIIARTENPLLVPREEYEHYGRVPNIIFPSGAMVKGKTLYIYYGAADTTTALATVNLADLLKEMLALKAGQAQLERFTGNPIIEPEPRHPWEAKATFNPAAIGLEGKVHLLYRAQSLDNTSVLGYVSSADGFKIDERLIEPVYVPREDFEKKFVPGGNSGCEDPRLTPIGEIIYMCYTAYNGKDHPRVALTSIATSDFIAKKWSWEKPVVISQPDADDKDAAIFPKKINGKYAILHRLDKSIWIDYADSLNFDGKTWIKGKILMDPRPGEHDSQKIGIAGPPLETKEGWLLLYHGISKHQNRHYHLRAALLDPNNPERVIVRTKNPIFEPQMLYEKEGLVPNVVFSCGAVIVKDQLLVYYGAADKVIGVATIGVPELLEKLLAEAKET